MNIKTKNKIKITYLFKKGRKKRLKNIEKCPSEFFYGYKELKNENYDLKILEEQDLNIFIKNIFITKILNFLSRLIFNMPLNLIHGFVFSKSFKKLQDSKYIIATTNSLGITLSLARNIGLIKSNIIFINMGLFDKKPSFIKIIFYKYLFNKTQLLTISKTEYFKLRSLLTNIKVKYIPFGVDDKFWFPEQKSKSEKYVLAIGNDLARDWKILVKAWDETFPMLKIVTSLPVLTNKKNIVVIKGNWHSQSLTDSEIRDLYRNSEFVVLPVRETLQPSGQSTCLQAMACSKAVLISNIQGIWDRELLKNGENIFFYKTGDIEDLKKSINFLAKNTKLRNKIEKNGLKLVKNHFNNTKMAFHLKKILEDQ